MKLLVTGAAGFIGSAFVRNVLVTHPDFQVVTLDKLTYAGNMENLAPVEGNPRHRFVLGDICDAETVNSVLADFPVDAIVHFAAESHVDRSILAPGSAVDTNVKGTATLLEAARTRHVGRFLHVSTDEVYGSIEAPIEATETSPLNPSSPYAASKAGADLLALAYVKTYRLPLVITRGSNNYGPYQFPEKLVPLMISNALERLPLPVYGDGQQIRDWMYVDDHCRGILAALTKGREGEIYNIGGGHPLANIDVVKKVLRIVGAPETLITTVADRPGHDRRYAIRCDKIANDTGFRPSVSFEEGLAATVDWYRSNEQWTRRVKSGAYRDYYRSNYEWRTVGQPGSTS
jgi:dTDP-glucose 4,6-dehydratase